MQREGNERLPGAKARFSLSSHSDSVNARPDLPHSGDWNANILQ